MPNWTPYRLHLRKPITNLMLTPPFKNPPSHHFAPPGITDPTGYSTLSFNSSHRQRPQRRYPVPAYLRSPRRQRPWTTRWRVFTAPWWFRWRTPAPLTPQWSMSTSRSVEQHFVVPPLIIISIFSLFQVMFESYIHLL